MKNHLGSYECKLCLTLHNNEVSSNIFFCIHNYKIKTNHFQIFKLKLVGDSGINSHWVCHNDFPGLCSRSAPVLRLTNFVS